MLADELTSAALAFADAHGAGDAPLATGIAGLTVLRQRRPSELRALVYEPVFCLVLQGAKQVLVGDRPVVFDRMQSVIISFELPTLARVVRASPNEPYVALALRLDMAVLRETAARMPDIPAGKSATGPVALAAADAAIIDAMHRLLGLVDRPEAAPILSPLIIREIHYWLLSAGHGAMLRALMRADGHAARIAAATARIRRDFRTPLRVGDLARDAGMSTSAFHDHFKAMTATTPLQFQKQLRLIEARRLIVETGATVSSAAFAVGYESPTQFSREYARRFGAPPRADLKRRDQNGRASRAGGGSLESGKIDPAHGHQRLHGTAG
ncbi:MAG: AraC family transcriptional regulator [Hyphomicrobiales bacterium]